MLEDERHGNHAVQCRWVEKVDRARVPCLSYPCLSYKGPLLHFIEDLADIEANQAHIGENQTTYKLDGHNPFGMLTIAIRPDRNFSLGLFMLNIRRMSG